MSNNSPQEQPRTAKDPLPRIFIVCAVITAVLMFIILGAIFLDMAARSQQVPVQPMVPRENPAASAGSQLEDAP